MVRLHPGEHAGHAGERVGEGRVPLGKQPAALLVGSLLLMRRDLLWDVCCWQTSWMHYPLGGMQLQASQLQAWQVQLRLGVVLRPYWLSWSLHE